MATTPRQFAHRPDTWPEKKLDTAVGLWAADWSATQIAETLRTTRNAVLGKVHRNRDLFPYRRDENGRAL